MTLDLKSILANVETVIASADTERAHDILRKLTSLFISEAPRFTRGQVVAFDAVIIRLARHVNVGARAELAGRLADVPNAPPTVIRDLAFDASAEIAGPLLQRSVCLAEDDLVHLAERCGREHLVALARRSHLGKQVTEVLVRRGNRDALRAVAENESASFSDRGHATLLKWATLDFNLRAALEKRSDIPPAYRKRLNALAIEQGEQALNDEFGALAQEAIMAATA